jgi:DNA-binding NarL/FixJ family response regulator
MVAYGHHFSLEDIQHCLEAGASAVIAHTTEDAALVNAIVGVFAGQRHLLLTQGKTPFERLCQQWRIRPERLAKLSPQQQCVLQFLGSGLPMKEIARQMNISSRTVETYEQRLKETLGLTCNTALRRTAILHHALDEFLQQSTTTAHLPPMAKTGSVMKNASS